MKYASIILLLNLSINSSLNSQSTANSEMIKITILYPNGEDHTFDMDYYATDHMPMIAEIYGPSMIKYEIDQGMSGRSPGEPPAYLAIGYLYFEKVSDYTDKFGPNAERILSDIPNYTNIQPTVLISKVVH